MAARKKPIHQKQFLFVETLVLNRFYSTYKINFDDNLINNTTIKALKSSYAKKEEIE